MSSRAILAVLSCLAVLFLLSCRLDIKYGRYAVVYGIADYQDTDINDLTYSDDDAISFSQLLTQQGYLVTLRVDAAAGRANLLADFATVAATAKEDDLFVFYYSGHGGQDYPDSGPSKEKSPNSDSPDEWIYPYDTAVNGSIDAATAISDDDLVALLRTITSKKKIVIIDACNSGGFIANQLEADAIPTPYQGSDESLAEALSRAISLYANFDGSSSDIPPGEAMVISASGERELSWEGLYGHGVMTYFLLKSDTRGDQNGDGYVTVSETYDYMRQAINLEWNALYGLDYAFSPHVSGGPVDYVLFTAR